MSGPKSYEYTYTPPDMSATYSFSMSSAEEAAGVMAQLSAVGSGVSVSISGGRITVHVSDGGYYAGYTESVIRSRVDKAREAYQKQLLQKRVRAAQTEVNALKSAIDSAANAKKAELSDAAAQCTALFTDLNVSAVTPFGSYNMANEQNEVRQMGMRFKTEQNAVESERQQCINNCNDYMRRVNSASSVSAVSSIVKPTMRISDTVGKMQAAALCRSMRDKKAKFNRFTSFLTELDRIIKNKGLEEFRSRITEKVRSVSVYSDSAISELRSLLEQIEGEKRYSLESAKLDKAAEGAKSKINAQLEALAEIKKLLVPLEADTENDGGVKLDYSELCAAAAADCDGVVSEIEGRSYVSAPDREAFEKAKGTLLVYGKTAASRELFDALKGLKSKLDEINKSSAAESERYDKFAEQVAAYTDLFYRFDNGSEALKNVLTALDDPEEFIYDIADADAQIKKLTELNAKLKAAADEYDREVMFAVMAERLSKSKLGKMFKKEKLQDGSLHITYVRTDSKGAIYDVICEEGKMKIYPRGVVLSNGKKTLTGEQLKGVHSTCRWADDITASYDELGIKGKYEELPQEECDKMYDQKNYYVIKSRDESIRFLKLCGYSQSEIEAFGYKSESGGIGGAADAQTETGTTGAREIKK